MASYHLNQQPIQRSRGDSSVAAAAYRSRSCLIDERTGIDHDYTSIRKDLLFEGIYAPAHAPAWAKDRARLWNEAEVREDRINSRPSRDFNLALHDELTVEQNRWMLQDFVKENFTRKGIVADVAIHAPHAYGNDKNIHAHIQITTRGFEQDGSWAKQKDRNLDKEATLETWRESWATIGSRHLMRHGYEEEAHRFAVAHLTLDKQREAALTRGDHEWARQLDRQAQIKLGKNAAAMERNGIATERGDRLREIEALNEARRQIAELERMAALEAKAEPQPALPKAAIPEPVLEPVLEPEPSARALDRQRAEDLAEEIERASNRKRVQSPARELFSAIKRLFVTLGGSLGNVLLTNPRDMRGDGSGVSETEKRNEAMRRALDEQRRNAPPQPAPRKAVVPEIEPAPAAPPRPQREAWMHQRGGAEPLNEQHLQEARKSYAAWCLANQERAAKFPFEKYVAYVQRKDAERNHEPDVEFNTGPMVKNTPLQPAPPAAPPTPAPQPRETYLERKRREARERGEIEPEFGPLPQKPRILEMEFGPRRKRNPHDNLPD